VGVNLLKPYTFDAGHLWMESWSRRTGKNYRQYWDRGHTEIDYLDEPMFVMLTFHPKKFCPIRKRLFRGHRIRTERHWGLKPWQILARCNGCGMGCVVDSRKLGPAG
jgi:hypothetical protein